MGEGISAASGGEGWVNHLSSRTFLGSILKPAQCEEFFRHIPGPRKNRLKITIALLSFRVQFQPARPVFDPFALLFRNPAYFPNGESPQNV